MDEWSEWPIKHFWFYLYGVKIQELSINQSKFYFRQQGRYMKSKRLLYIFTMCIFNKLSIVLYSVHWYVYNAHSNKLSLRAAVVANRSSQLWLTVYGAVKLWTIQSCKADNMCTSLTEAFRANAGLSPKSNLPWPMCATFPSNDHHHHHHHFL